jgi:hypothetical protein
MSTRELFTFKPKHIIVVLCLLGFAALMVGNTCFMNVPSLKWTLIFYYALVWPIAGGYASNRPSINRPFLLQQAKTLIYTAFIAALVGVGGLLTNLSHTMLAWVTTGIFVGSYLLMLYRWWTMRK